MRKEEATDMVKLRRWTLLFAIWTAALLPGQTRELRTLPPQPPPAGNGSSAGSFHAGDTLSTMTTSAAVALGPGDLLEIAVFDTPELAQRVRVNSDGKIVSTLIGEIDVRGMKPDALEQIVRTKLVAGHFVKDPQVSVFVVEFAGQTAYITGEVNRPGAYPLMRSHHLMDMIAVAGGLSGRAGNAVTITHNGDSSATMVVDISDKDQARRDPEILPGDSITVGQTGIVYVLGDVSRPGGFLLDRRGTLSVVQAVALAEGALPSASIRKAQLIRTIDGNRQETVVDLKSILHSDIPDPQLHPGDILYLPGSLTHGLGRATIQTIIATISGIAIYSAAYR